MTTPVYTPQGGQPVYFPRRGLNAPVQQPQGRLSRMWNRVPQQPARSDSWNHLPAPLRHGALNNRSVVFNMWIVAMILVSFDEWHNLGILPRPARLWDTTLIYGVLVLLGFVDAMVPLSNALAIGYTIVLLVQYFQGNITPEGNTQTGTATSGNAQAATAATGTQSPTSGFING